VLDSTISKFGLEHDAIKQNRNVLSSHSFWSMILSEKSAIFRDHALSPRPRCLHLFLEARDLVFLHQREADVIEAIEQAVLAVRVDVEPDPAAVGAADFLLFEIDCEAGIGAALGIVEQLLQVVRADPCWQTALLYAPFFENVA